MGLVLALVGLVARALAVVMILVWCPRRTAICGRLLLLVVVVVVKQTSRRVARPHNSGGVVAGDRFPRPLVYAPRGRGFCCEVGGSSSTLT